MEGKHGKYVVNIEHSENPALIMCSNDQEAHSSACWRLPSNNVTSDVSSNLSGVCVNPGVLTQSGYPHTDLSHTQVKENCYNNSSLWKAFLACLLACVITKAIGVLIICLVNNRGNGNSSICIQIVPKNGKSIVIIPGATSTTSQPTVTPSSTELTTVTTSTESTSTTTTATIISAEPTT
uniref:Dynactin associated protein n=1 Tax=Catagonus wagneri TaxID=51154 RepID=A0A8C3WUY0_9CETA